MSPCSEKPVILNKQSESMKPGAMVQHWGQSYATDMQNKMSL